MGLVNRDDFIAAVHEAGLYIMQKEDIPAFVECATSGYTDYPLFNHFCGGEYDVKEARCLWEVFLRSMPKEAVCFSDRKDLRGFAIWLPASYRGTSVLSFFTSGGIKLPFVVDFGVFARLLRYETHAQKVRLELTKGEGWYFYNLVTRADCQGMGVGGSLMRPAFALMDKFGEISYLETHAAKNVPLYEHYGFSLESSSNLPGKYPMTHYGMVRKPR